MLEKLALWSLVICAGSAVALYFLAWLGGLLRRRVNEQFLPPLDEPRREIRMYLSAEERWVTVTPELTAMRYPSAHYPDAA